MYEPSAREVTRSSSRPPCDIRVTVASSTGSPAVFRTKPCTTEAGPSPAAAVAGAASSLGSTARCGSRFSSHPGSHQLESPSRCIAAGTSAVRRMNASSATAAARPTPAIAAPESPLSTKARKTQTMIRAAELMTRLVSARPTRTARALSLVCTHSSCIRLTRKTW